MAQLLLTEIKATTKKFMCYLLQLYNSLPLTFKKYNQYKPRGTNDHPYAY
jgi:hypothetical protein